MYGNEEDLYDRLKRTRKQIEFADSLFLIKKFTPASIYCYPKSKELFLVTITWAAILKPEWFDSLVGK